MRTKLTDKQRKIKAAKSAAKKLEDLMAYVWRFICYERAGRKCEVCGTKYERGDFRLQAHHLVKRSQSKRLQLDPMNSMALCPGHHQFADRDVVWAIGIADKLRPGVAAYLVKERPNMTKIHTHEIIENLLYFCDLYGLEDEKITELREYR